MDLRAELKRRRSGEDGRITIERQWERRCNLDGDFGALDTTPMRQAGRTPTSPCGIWGWQHGACPTSLHGGMAVQVPTPFAREVNGSVNPTEFLQIYSTSILAARGNEAIMANYFLVALTSTS
jgi:hypothetical protein